MKYFEKSIHMKRYLMQVDKLWYERFHNFITYIQDKKGYNPSLVAQNPNTNIIELLDNNQLKDYVDVFISNPNINSQILDSLSNIEWNFSLIHPQAYISIEFIIKHFKTRKFNWFSISSNKHFTMHDIHFYRTIPWDFKGVSRNPNLDWYHIQLFHKNKKDLDWEAISKHPNITMQIIKGNSMFPWNVDGMSLNPNITSKFIALNPGVKWNYMLLSENPAVKLRFIFKNLDKPWCWVKISSHPRLTIGIIQKYPQLKWNWYRISANSAFNLDIARHYIDFPWSFAGFSANPNIRLNTIIENLDKGWDFNEVCGNIFTREKNKFYEYHLRKYFMAKKIAVFWKKRITDMNYAIGRKMQSQKTHIVNQDNEEYYEEPDNIKHSNLTQPQPPRLLKPPRPKTSKPVNSARFLPLPPIPVSVDNKYNTLTPPRPPKTTRI